MVQQQCAGVGRAGMAEPHQSLHLQLSQEGPLDDRSKAGASPVLGHTLLQGIFSSPHLSPLLLLLTSQELPARPQGKALRRGEGWRER